MLAPHYTTSRFSSTRKTMWQISPFFIQKALDAIAGKVKNAFQFMNGTLLVQVFRDEQAETVLKSEFLKLYPFQTKYDTSQLLLGSCDCWLVEWDDQWWDSDCSCQLLCARSIQTSSSHCCLNIWSSYPAYHHWSSVWNSNYIRLNSESIEMLPVSESWSYLACYVAIVRVAMGKLHVHTHLTLRTATKPFQ
jgi:hypothetical protein